jgi:hypothetical protein
MNTRIALNTLTNRALCPVTTTTISLHSNAQPTRQATITNTTARPSLRHQLVLGACTLLLAIAALTPAAKATAQKLIATYPITITSGTCNGKLGALTGTLKLYQPMVASNACEALISVGPFQQYLQQAPGSFTYYSNFALAASGFSSQTGNVIYIPKANLPGQAYNGLPFLILQSVPGGWSCGAFIPEGMNLAPCQINSADIVIVFSAGLKSVVNAAITCQGSISSSYLNPTNYLAYFTSSSGH